MEKDSINGISNEHEEHEKLSEDEEMEQSRYEIDYEKVSFRHRLIHTACVCFSLLALGWRNSMIGPTLPDLRLIIDADLSTTSWIFTAKSFGGIFGSVVGGLAYDRFNKICVLIFMVTCMGVSSGFVPWCNNIILMCLVHVIHGACNAGLDAAATADVGLVWKKKNGPYMQAVHGAFSIGTIISPLICEPFLVDATNINHDSLNLTLQTFHGDELTNESSYNIATNISDIRSIRSRPVNESNIHVPYLIAMGVLLSVGVSFVLSRLIYGDVYKSSNVNKSVEQSEFSGLKNKQYFLSSKWKTVFSILLAVLVSLACIGEYCFVGFLMTFLTTELKWDSASGSNATSVFWIAFALGRLTGVFIVKWLRLSTVLISFLIICNVGVIMFWLSVSYNVVILTWISIGVVGYGLSVLFPSLFSWLSECVRCITGKLCSMFLVSVSIGNMTIPRLSGYLMDKISQLWFIYAMIIISISMLCLFIFIIGLYKSLERRHTSRGVRD